MEKKNILHFMKKIIFERQFCITCGLPMVSFSPRDSSFGDIYPISSFTSKFHQEYQLFFNIKELVC